MCGSCFPGTRQQLSLSWQGGVVVFSAGAGIERPAVRTLPCVIDPGANTTAIPTPVVPGVNTASSALTVDLPEPAADAPTDSLRGARAVIDRTNRLTQQVDAANAKLTAAGGTCGRQPLPGGRLKLKPEYHKRVQVAEKSTK